MFQPTPPDTLARAVIVAAALFATAAQPLRAATITAAQAGVPNFGQVNDNYYRGGQPDRAGLGRLNALGVKTIIDLQGDGPRAEGDWVKAAGMTYYNIPLSSSRPATEEQTKQFLALVNDSKNWPVYVHCAGGRHRTGEMTAIYRITHDTWTADEAFAEMQKYDWYAFPNHGSLKTYVFKYYDGYKLASADKPVTSPSTSATSDAAIPAAAAATAAP